ncbi:MAG TPA: MG2 domain-containing protein [Bacteroidota bacterium]|nr:MG2 domain-containing protein [Bacteroidota bacterium]
MLKPQIPRLIIMMLFLSSCSKKETEVLELASPLPSGVVQRDAPIILFFSKAVVPPDSTNQWTASPYIEFTPVIPGKFTWRDTSTLVFSADGPLPGDVKFKAKLNTPLLTNLAGMKSFNGADEFTFATQSFTMRNAEFFYDRVGKTRTVGIRANLEFTYAVNPAEVVKYMRLVVDNEARQPQSGSSQNSTVIPIEIGTTTQLQKDKDISITFDDRLISVETNTRIRMDTPFVFKLPGLEEVKIYGHEFGTDGAMGWISFKTSQEIDLSSAKASITLNPDVQFTLEGNRQSFTMKGKFNPGTTFHLVIRKGIESVLGGKSQNDYEADIVVGNVKPSFGFASASGVYMMLGGQKTLELKTVNLSKLIVTVSQVFQNNLVFFLDQGRYYDYYNRYDYEYYDEEGDYYHPYSRKYRYVLQNFGRRLGVDTLLIRHAINREATSRFNLGAYLNNGYKGFYVVEIADSAEPWRSTSKLISVSNIGLIAKQSPNEVMVFATSLETNEPLPGVTINLISTNNQTIATLKSDDDGVARFGKFKELRKDFALKLITAELENDFNFINLLDYRVETSRFKVEGKHDAQNVYDAFLYGDRTIYRPGEKIYLSGILRNLNNPLPSQIPVRLKIFNPRGLTVRESQHTLNEQGSFETSYETQPASLTGTYTFELLTGNGLYLTSYQVSVEDFVPDRLKVNLKASADTAMPGEKIKYQLLALNFFGPPAANRKYEFEGTFDILPFVSKKYPEFRFSDEAAKNYAANPEVQSGKTDGDGKALIEFGIPDNVTSQGLLRARGRVAVFDESGRPVYQVSQTIVPPKEYFIGMKNLGAFYVTPNQSQTVQLVGVNEVDEPIKGFKAKVELMRLEWHSVLRQAGESNTLRYVSEQREIPVRSETIILQGTPFDYMYVVPRSGQYILRVSKAGGEGYNQLYFYSYDWATADITSFPISPEAHVEMVFDKKTYAPGEKAQVLFQAPFSGKMLVTVERNQVFEYSYLDVVNNAASMEIPIEDAYLPNAYVSVVLFRKIKEMNIPLMVGHGFAPVMVEKKSNNIHVSIKAPDKIRPKTKQSVTVLTGLPGAFLTLAAVDEGILQVKNYKTPDPYEYFYAKKALETETFDFFRHLIPEPGKSASGGGEGNQMARRVNPLGVQRFKPVAIWSGIRRTNEYGDVEVTLDVPEFSGELRLMVFSYKGDSFGSAQKGMKVADPIVITPALPRFLSSNDSMSMTITAFNTTDKTAQLSFGIETTGPIVALSNNTSLEVGANQERYVTLDLRTTSQVGKATVKVRTSGLGESFESTTDIPVRPISPFTSDALIGAVDGGTTVTHDIPDVYLSYNRKSYITFSPFPVANFARELKYLIGYPHGCLEQTTSKAFPQVYLRDIALMLDPSILNHGSPAYFVNEAITKIVAMQMPDGGFSYWPGGDYANPWTTVYATHFLLESRKAGYAVPDHTIKGALTAIGQLARSKKTQEYHSYGPGQKVTIKRIADKSAVYALYVLALGGMPDKNLMNYYRVEKSLMTTDTRYLLAGAFALSGDRKTFLELLPPEFITEEAKREAGYNFDSPIRANALILNVLFDTDLNNSKIPLYLEYLSRSYRNYYWCSTQDNAFTLLAFGKAARIASSTKADGAIRVGEKSKPYGGGNQKVDIDPFGKKVSVSMNGTGRVYYSLVTEGIRTDGKVRIEDKNLQVRREFLNRQGNPVDMQAIKQNDLIIVKLTLNCSIDNLENVAISDLLPAGFEIENPRITETTDYAFIKNATSPVYMDIRDDRINIYTNVFGNRQQFFYYMVRAVTAGTFVYAPVVAEAMYDANYYSASGYGKVKVGR